jgi:hypothetical protein
MNRRYQLYRIDPAFRVFIQISHVSSTMVQLQKASRFEKSFIRRCSCPCYGPREDAHIAAYSEVLGATISSG